MYSIPVSVVLLLLYLAITIRNLRGHRRAFLASEQESGSGWSFRASLAVLAAATIATALISEILVHSLDAFAHAAGLSEFFIAAVIVAIVGNAAEHGGAIVIARRGNLVLATEIAVSSSAQVALFVAPAVALLSFLVSPALPLAFRPVELAAMGGAALFVLVVTADGRSRRWEGFLLVAVYAAIVGGFYAVGDR